VVELANHTALVSKDGRVTPIEDSAAPIRYRDGTIGGAVLVFRDVSEARRAMEARSHLAAIVDSSDDAIIGQSPDGIIQSWNRGAERLYGYKAAEIVGKSLSVLVPDDHPEELPQIMERLRRGETIEHLETERIRKDGRRVDVSLTISPIVDAEGTIIGSSKIARDITARKEEDRRKSEFLALLAHELRNPLAPLRNGLQVIRLAGDDRQTVEQCRAVMERQLEHLVRLVDDLLDISRISRGKLQLQKERISLASIVEHSLDLCGQNVRGTDHELTVELPDGPLYVDADRTRISQAICNLLSNAAKYSDPGTPVRLSVRREGAEAVIRVRDQGVGIPADQLPRVFEMFMQLERTLERSQGGLGVGLTIVKRLAEMHGGGVEARSEGLGKGSEFIIRLPAVATASNDGAQVGVEPHRSKRIGRRVVVVDDNHDAAATLSTMLRMMGSEVSTAYDGETGIAAAAEMRPQLILLDIGMPKLNGYDAARRIRGEPWGRLVTLVALTGWGQEEDRRKSEEAGFDFHLVKPVEPSALEQLLASVPDEGPSA
jgi:PAS domain S-box-containing protein